MIGKITTGKDFGGLVNYLLDPSKTPQLIGTNLLSQKPNDMIEELEWISSQNTRCKKPVKHISLSFAPQDGEVLDQIVYDIVDDVLEGLGYDDNQYMVVRHDRSDPERQNDHNHDHLHILINAIRIEGDRVRDSFDKTKLERILREQELKHNLTVVPSSSQRKHKSVSTGQVRRMAKEIEERKSQNSNQGVDAPYMSKLQSGIDLASHDCPTLAVFLARLQRLKIDSQFRINNNGDVTGIAYRMQDFKVKGCKLHNASFSKLLTHRVNFNQSTDIGAIVAVNAKEQLPLPDELKVSWNQVNVRDYLTKKIKQELDLVYGERKVEPIKKVNVASVLAQLERQQQSEDKDKGWEMDV